MSDIRPFAHVTSPEIGCYSDLTPISAFPKGNAK